MIITKPEPFTKEEIEKVAQDLDGYIKVVIDIKQNILAAGGIRHAEAEQVLIRQGSNQGDLWGGGLDLETGEIDYDSMINIRPNDNNPSREVLSQEIRQRMTELIKMLLVLK